MGVLLSWANLVQSVTVSATHPPAAGFAVADLLTPQVYDVWRSASWGATTITIDADIGSAQSVKLVAVAAPRDGTLPSATATIRLTAGTSAGSTSALDTGTAVFTMSPWGVWGWRSVAGVSARYWRLSFTGAAADAYLQLGRIWVGSALITSRGYAFGASRGTRDPGQVSRAGLTGARYATLGRPYRVEQLGLPALTSPEATQVEAMGAAVGSTGQVFAARSDAALGDGLFGVFAQPPTVSRPYPQIWRADLQIEEDA